MKKNNKSVASVKKKQLSKSAAQEKIEEEALTIGIDLGDKSSQYCVLNAAGEVTAERSVATTKQGMAQAFGARKRCRIALEVGTHSAWVSRLLNGLGHEVIVANARQVKLIGASSKKDDKFDARTLARLARVDPQLLRPIRHRSEKAQLDLLQIRVRAVLVETRTSLVNTVRGLVKALGERLPPCDADQMGVNQAQGLPKEWQEQLKPLLEAVESLTQKIKASDAQLEQIARKEYPETQLLKQVKGVGPLIALTYVLTVEDPQRFQKSRDVGCYVGLRPKRRDSGETRPQLGITKEGDAYLRKLLVQGAHCVLSPHGPDTDLKRWGWKLCERGGKNARKRAIVAVARKLAVLLHCLWVTGEVYEPLRNSKDRAAATTKAAA
jgi:transposase